MFADIWYVFDSDDLALWLQRVSGVVFGVVVIVLTITHFRHQRRWRRIPTALKWSTYIWFGIWFTTACILLLTNYAPFGEYFRATYGTMFVGVMISFFWSAYYYGKDYDDDECSGDGRCELHNALMDAMREASVRIEKEDVGIATGAERAGGTL